MTRRTTCAPGTSRSLRRPSRPSCRGDLEAAARANDEGSPYTTTTSPRGEEGFHGRDGWFRWLEEFGQSWDEFWIEPDEIVATDDETCSCCSGSTHEVRPAGSSSSARTASSTGSGMGRSCGSTTSTTAPRQAERPGSSLTATEHVQRDQPDGVPPLELTGERTLPDVPAENYWYRRHLAVYEWIAGRSGGLDVVDLACGEGYGTDVLARRAAKVTGVDANPDAHEHARLKYTRPGVSFVARPGGELRRASRRSRLPPDDRARGGAGRAARPLPRDPEARRHGDVSTPTSSRSRPRGRSARATRGTSTSTARTSTASSASAASRASSCWGSSTPASYARTSWPCGSAGTRSTRGSA